MSKWDIKVIDADNIDQKKWSEMLLRTPELIAQYNEHWFLTAISDKWQAYVYGDYISAFPCVYKIKYGVRVMYQPFFSREFSLLGEQNHELLNEILSLIHSRFTLIKFNSELSIKNFDYQITSMNYQFLKLNKGYSEIFENYATNAKRILKKNSSITIAESNNSKNFIELFKEKVGSKLGYRSTNYNCLRDLIDQGMEKDVIKLYSLNKQNENYGYACFYFYRNVINYIKGSLTDAGKQNGAMYVMFDHLIKNYSGTDKILDFGGSNIEGVASFYRKFGSEDNIYYSYEKNQMPLVLKKIYDFRQKYSS